MFAEDWADARSRFRSAAHRARLELEAFVHPTATAPDGSPLTVDVACSASRSATHVLFNVCGTHGVEGYPGNAAMVSLMDSGRLQALPDHVAVVFLHGLNPFGWSRDSQRNEDGIDLNRNFIDFSSVPETDHDLVMKIAEILDNETMSFLTLGVGMQALLSLRDEVGAQRFMTAFGGGQYTVPKGFKFGGTSPSWSNQIYRRVIRQHLSAASHIAELDWHTGLGRYGQPFPLFFGRPGSDEYAQTCDWWGKDAVDRGLGSWSEDDPNAPAPSYCGLTSTALREELSDARIGGGVVEFGTMPIAESPQLLILDHWLTFNAHDDVDAAFWRAQMRTFMAPREPSWERSVLGHAERLYAKTLEGLAAWR